MRTAELKTLSLVVVAAVGIPCLACLPQPGEPGLEQQLQTLVDRTVAENDAVSSAALHVDSTALDLDWEGAAGMADPESGRMMTPETPARIASNTKTFVAATVLRLAEEGALDIDDPIGTLLPRDFVEMLEGDGYDANAMTLRHLLTHTSGLFDHTASELYIEAIMADPTHEWTRTEQVARAVDWGDPHGEPGEFYTYCDTGYVLLGAVIERAAGMPMAEAVRELLDFDGLGLESTWWEVLEQEPEGVVDRAHQFLGDVDSYSFEPHYDLYGGGGLVSTVGDLARFYRALFAGDVFTDPGTLDLMLTPVDGAEILGEGGPSTYRMGIWEVEVEGLTTYRHTGFFGTLATYVPELDLTVTATVNQNQAREALGDLARDAILLAAESREQPSSR